MQLENSLSIAYPAVHLIYRAAQMRHSSLSLPSLVPPTSLPFPFRHLNMFISCHVPTHPPTPIALVKSL